MTVKQSEYAPLGDLVFNSLSRDLPDFTAVFTNINAGYQSDFSMSLENVKKIKSTKADIDKQKKLTKNLYSEANLLGVDFKFLKRYSAAINISDGEFKELSKKVNTKDIEEVVKISRSIITRVENHVPVLEHGGMPSGFLTQLSVKVNNIEKLNAEQNIFIQSRPAGTASNAEIMAKLYSFISEVCDAGKLIYAKNPQKKGDYTITKVMKLLKT
jgi:hypothetical protein